MDQYFEALEKSKNSVALNIVEQMGFDETADILEKGRAAQMGEMRIWNNIKYQKTPNGWVPVKEEKAPKVENKEEKPAEKQESEEETKVSKKGVIENGKWRGLKLDTINQLKGSGWEEKGNSFFKDFGDGITFEIRRATDEERQQAYKEDGRKSIVPKLEKKSLWIVKKNIPKEIKDLVKISPYNYDPDRVYYTKDEFIEGDEWASSHASSTRTWEEKLRNDDEGWYSFDRDIRDIKEAIKRKTKEYFEDERRRIEERRREKQEEKKKQKEAFASTEEGKKKLSFAKEAMDEVGVTSESLRKNFKKVLRKYIQKCDEANISSSLKGFRRYSFYLDDGDIGVDDDMHMSYYWSNATPEEKDNIIEAFSELID